MRKGLGYHNRRSPFGFNPGTLFAGGAAGVWYDPSDASTLFSDTAGTTPSPTPGAGALSVVGKMLDKSGNGNHAISYNTTTARPELSARVNLLTYSEQFNNAAWVKLTGGGGSVPVVNENFAVAPDGTTTASRVVLARSGNAVTDYSGIVQSITASSQTRTFSVWMKSNTTSSQNVAWGDSTTNYTTAVVTTSWQRFSLSNTSTNPGFIIITRGGQPTFANSDASLDILVWGADLRPANIGTSVPAYQRIADQYTYDSSGFPRYLVANGTSTLMTHGFGINANVTLMAAARRTGGPGEQGLFGATPPSTRLVGLLTANAVNPNWGTYAGAAFQSSGQSILETSAVISNVAEPSLPSQKLYTNQSLSATITGALFGGDPQERRIIFADYTPPTTRLFAGNLYGIIAVAKILTDGERTSAVTWLGNKMGQTI